MTIISEIDLKFKSGNAIQVQDVRITRDEWRQVKSYIEGISAKPSQQAELERFPLRQNNGQV